MSAKWRRNKKSIKKFEIFKALKKNKTKTKPLTFGIRTLKVKGQRYPSKYPTVNINKERQWKEPDPLIDVLEEKDEIIVVAEFARFRRETLKINVKNQHLSLSAEAFDRKYHKSLNLPKRVIPSNVRTTYKNGVLEIRLRKAPEEKAIDKVAG